MSQSIDFSAFDIGILAILAVVVVALVVVTVQWRRSRAEVKRMQQPSASRRSPGVHTVTGLAVKAVAETAVRVRERGVSGFLMSSIDDISRWVLEDKPSIARVAAPDGTVTIVFSDIEGSTALNEQLGDRAWVALLAKHDALLRSVVESHGGHIVKSQGDGFMIVFGAPELAVDAALTIQRKIATPRGRLLRRTPIRVRIGAHIGSAIEREGDYFGRNVALAARVAAQADGGEVLVSAQIYERLAKLNFDFREVENIELKGFAGTQTLWFVSSRR